MLELTLLHELNGRYVPLKLGRVWSKMNTYFIFDKQILEWLLVALHLPSLGSNGQKSLYYKLERSGQLLGHPVYSD